MARFVFNPLTGEFDLVRRLGEGRHVGVELIGVIDGVNQTFTTPSKFIHGVGGENICVYYNGQRLSEGGSDDYTVSESGGPGTGHDTVSLSFAPKSSTGLDRLTADYTEL